MGCRQDGYWDDGRGSSRHVATVTQEPFVLVRIGHTAPALRITIHLHSGATFSVMHEISFATAGARNPEGGSWRRMTLVPVAGDQIEKEEQAQRHAAAAAIAQAEAARAAAEAAHPRFPGQAGSAPAAAAAAGDATTGACPYNP